MNISVVTEDSGGGVQHNAVPEELDVVLQNLDLAGRARIL